MSNAPNSMPSGLRSELYFARPLDLAGPSRRLMRLPHHPPFVHRRPRIIRHSVPPFSSACGFKNGLADAHVGSAAAQIAAEPVFTSSYVRIRIALQEIRRRNHEARRAIAALLGIVVYERGGSPGASFVPLEMPSRV